MKHLFILLVLSGILNFAFAQDSSKVCENELRHGLEFQIGSMLTLTNYENYTFSYRYRFNNNSGLRIGVNLIALPIRLTSICLSLVTSPTIQPGVFSSMK